MMDILRKLKNIFAKMEKTMENLLNCDGRRFRAKINGVECEGKVRVEYGRVYLCQDKQHGVSCKDKLGYPYSWCVEDGRAAVLEREQVWGLCLLGGMPPAEIEAYKDWRVGDRICNGNDVREVIFRSGKLVVCENEGECAYIYTCNELYKKGWRLVADPAPEDETVELTMDEIAAKFGIKAEKLRIKKEEDK